MNKGTQQPDLFNYLDYRTYLKDTYQYLKKNKSFFSYRYFSRVAGFSAPNFYKLVADGQRNLSSDGIEKFANALKLKAKEAKYFRLLVLYDQAKNANEKDFFIRQILKNKHIKAVKPLSEAQYDYYSKWFLLALRELVTRKDFKRNFTWIATQFLPPISEKEAKEGMKILYKLGLIKENKDGTFEQVDKALTSGDSVASQAILNYHQQMIHMGAEAIERFDATQREVSTLTIGTTDEKAKKLKKMIQEFQQEIMNELASETEVEKVIQLNFQLFPLTTTGENNNSSGGKK